MIKDPFVLYRQPRVKKFLNTIVLIVLALIIMFNAIDLLAVHGIGNFWGYLGGTTFMSSIVVGIFLWLGYLILNGKFRPPDNYQKGAPRNQNIPPHLRQPMHQPQYQQRPPPQQIQQIQQSIDYCSFCGKSFPTQVLRPFVDRDGNVIHVCGDCFRNES